VLVAQGAWSAALQAAFAPFSLTGLVSSPPMAFQPMLLSRRPLPFDHPEWIFELKYERIPLTRRHPKRAKLNSSPATVTPSHSICASRCMRARQCLMEKSSALTNRADHNSAICFSIEVNLVSLLSIS
jgi:hypothetical protein